MKYTLKILTIALFIIIQDSWALEPDPHKSPMAVVIMVKDEVDVIIPTLQPFIEGGIDAILVYDTGSTDGTQEKIQSYFKDHNLHHAHLIEEPFVDFSTSRNRSLDLAEELFPNIPLFLMLDAEWYTHNVPGLVAFCKEHELCEQEKCYAVRLMTAQDNLDHYTVRIMRRNHHVRYIGVVHESIPIIANARLPYDIYFEYNPKETGREKSNKRCKRDYELLKKSLMKDPYNQRTLFYLGQTCQFLDDWEQAIYYYYKRAEYNDMSEECYLAYYRIGCAIEYIMHQCAENNKSCHYKWENALFYYLKAYNMLPHRAEPLVRIAAYYLRENQHAIAYLFAHRAAQLPYPIHDVLFVEKNAYEAARYDILGQCALYVGEYEEGKNAVLKALKADPTAQHLHHNLSVYLRFLPL